MLQSIHAILHNILFLELHSYKGTVQYSILHIYSTIRITILILQCSCEQIYFQAFLFQKCIAEIFNRQDSTFYLGELQFFSLQSIAPRLHSVYTLLDYRQSTCTQTTCSLHPLESTTQPTRTFLLGEYADSTGRSPSNILLKPGQEFYQQKS